MTSEYDPETCITAGELRMSGLVIPENIPDCGWVRRSAIRAVPGDGQLSSDGRFSIGIALQFNEPFQWISVSVEVEE